MGCVVELGSTDTHTVGRRAETVDCAPLRGAGSGCGIASRGPAISRRNKHGDALRRRLLPQAVDKAVSRGAECSLAQTEAHAHHRRQIVADDVLRGEIDAVTGTGGLGDDEFDGSIPSYRARPLDIEISFGFFARTENSRIGAVDDDLRIVRGQAERGAELAHVCKIDVGAGNDGDRLSAAIDGLLIKRGEVIDGGEIRWGEIVGAAAGEFRDWNAGSVIHGGTAKIVQRDNSSDYSGEGRGDFGIARVGVMNFIANLVGMNLGVKGRLYLRCRAAEYNRSTASRDLRHFHTMRLQPCSNLRRVGFGDAKALAILFGSEPLMKVRGVGIMLRVEQLFERILLGGIGQQGEHHAIHAIGRRDRAGVELRDGRGMAVATQDDALLIVNEGGDPVLRLTEQRIRRIGWRLGAGGYVLRKQS